MKIVLEGYMERVELAKTDLRIADTDDIHELPVCPRSQLYKYTYMYIYIYIYIYICVSVYVYIYIDL